MFHLLTLFLTLSSIVQAQSLISESVFVESPTDTDGDGKKDLIYVSIRRPMTSKKLSTIYAISPYAQGGNNVSMHSVEVELLPQDEDVIQKLKKMFQVKTKIFAIPESPDFDGNKYAEISAHSLGTGRSTGCPTVGDKSEIFAAKAVIEWLNGKARAFDDKGIEVKADWANGKVGMTGTSYDGTLPIMVATTGVEGLKAIIPVAAISNWYNYYRANGLVVNPGGYEGEDADILGYFIVRRGACLDEMKWITDNMGRENGDFTPFWQERNHLALAKNIKAATFIIHGQSDWNVKQRHAIELWEALEGVVPRRMFLHRGGHGSTYNHNVPRKVQDWFDHFLEDENNGITNGPQVEVELPDGSLMIQNEWPHEKTLEKRFYLGAQGELDQEVSEEKQVAFTDSGKDQRLEILAANPEKKDEGRLVFLAPAFSSSTILSGTSKVTLNLSLLNRKAANLTVAVVEYSENGKAKMITRGWVDPQNYRDLTQGELLVPGQFYQVSFALEPKQYKFPAGSRLGILVASTDYDYTLRPKKGTKLQVKLGAASYIDLNLSAE